MTHHLAILKPRYVRYLLAGKKTIECRFSRTRRPPFRRVRPGDTLWIKLSGGLVVAKATVHQVVYFHPLTTDTFRKLHRQYGRRIQADKHFYADHRNASFASVISLQRISALKPFRILKRDRRAWVVLQTRPRPESQLH